MRKFRFLITVIALGSATALGLSSCSSSGTGGSDDQLVLAADPTDLGGYNPLLTYMESGVSPLYEGLLVPSAPDDDRVPDLVPSLAAEKPQEVAPRTWRVPLREGVTFSDGSTFDSEDVVATYRAVTDPVVASDIASKLGPVTEVVADGPLAVTVRTDTDADPSPYLLVGIVPSEKVESAPAADWAINAAPVGTGPYTLESLHPDQAVFTAREDHHGGAPALKRVIYTAAPDDNNRAQRVTAGEVDGANLPPKLADSVSGKSGVELFSVETADWRGISLPAGNAFTTDLAARRAMNVAVDRRKLVDEVLAGHGVPASTPVSEVYGAAYEPQAQYTFDRTQAEKILDDADWRRDGDGIREKNGQKASFTVLYNPDDTLRRDLTVATAAQLKEIGIEIVPRGASWDEVDTRLADDAVLLGGGDTPYSIDSQVYDVLHTRVPGASPYSNPGDFTAPGMDDLLDQARESAAGPENDARYRRVQALYKDSPSSLFLVFLRHTYVSRTEGWKHAAPILEPHAHGVNWGPWWNLPSWKR